MPGIMFTGARTARQAERRAVARLQPLLTDVGTRFWPAIDLKLYLETICAEAGFKVLGQLRINGASGDSSVRMEWPGGSDRWWLRVQHFRRESGLYAATAGLGRG